MKPLQNAAASCLRYSVRTTLCHSQKLQANVSQISITTNRLNSSEVSKETDRAKKISIPKRVERSPTDILKALSSTVKRDYNAPDYKYHDDPFLIPTSNVSKRMFALSQESGRKAARWIRQEHAELFQHKVADPFIEAFRPQAVYDENSEVDENVLLKVIALHQVADAVTVYNLLEKKSVEISRATKQSLLELLCFYNGQDILEEEWIEERWFKQSSKSRDKKKNVWKKGGVADKLFESMAPHDSASYSAMLCGKAQSGDIEGAYRLYQEALDANIGVPTEAFNKLIGGAGILKEGHELRWQFVEEMMGAMKQQGQAPDLGTLNAILESISSMYTNRNSQKYALEVLAEFRTLGIEPSMASYFFLLRTFCQDRSPMRCAILVNILDLLQDKPLSIRDPRDVMFFLDAMEVCRFHLSDLELAHRVDRLLHAADNYNLIGDSFKENQYYRNYFALICQMGTMKELMAHYDKLVPNIYVPEPGIMEEILKTVELNEAWDLLPRMWTDLVTFEQANREPSIRMMLGALQASQTTDAKLSEQLADIAWSIWTRVNGQPDDRINRISWTGEMLGDIIQQLLRADRYEQTIEVVTFLDKKQQEILGVPAIESMAAFLDKSIQRNEIKNAIWCIQYCSDAGYEDTIRLAQKLNDSVSLSEADRNQLVNIVGADALQKQAAAAIS